MLNQLGLSGSDNGAMTVIDALVFLGPGWLRIFA